MKRDGDLENKGVEFGSTKEKQVVALIKEIEIPFLTSMQETYGKDKGWRLCGPSSIALSRIISSRLDIPVGIDLPGEHLELAIGIYDPKEATDRLGKIEEHVYIKYFVGDKVDYIDPIYQLLMKGRTILGGAIHVENYTPQFIDKGLEIRHQLFKFNERDMSHLYAFQFRKDLYGDLLTAMNSSWATEDSMVISGRSIRTNWNKTKEVIQRFSPEWKTDPADLLMMAEAHFNKGVELMPDINKRRSFDVIETFPRDEIIRTKVNRLIGRR